MLAFTMREWRIRLGVVCGLAACNTAPQAPMEQVWQEQAWQDLEEAKSTAAAAKGEPRAVVFPGHGEITVRDWNLEGYPDNTYVRARFTYENTTGRQVDWVRVWLTVMDAEGNLVARQIAELFMPWTCPSTQGVCSPTSSGPKPRTCTGTGGVGSGPWDARRSSPTASPRSPTTQARPGRRRPRGTPAGSVGGRPNSSPRPAAA